MKVNPIPEYRTERLILRGVTLADAPSYTEHFVDYDVIRYLSQLVPWPYPEHGVEEYLKNSVLPNQGNGQWTWGIFVQNEPSKLIGCIDLWKEGKPENRGFWLGKKYWNKGIMTESVFPVLDFAFYNIGFEYLIFANAVGNIASRKIKEKTGCELFDVKPAKFVDPAFTQHELWKLTIENWEKHTQLNPSVYVEVKD
ncbi:MAG: GNAT family N-acetyltransferase [Bacteroidales bacterium]|nr:GNAT family N-acetyltransferase [Bacteroidales bacterium]